MGVALGESGVGIHFEDAELAHSLGFAALAVILAEGGLTTSWREMRGSIRLGVSLATVGVAGSGGGRARPGGHPPGLAGGGGGPLGGGHPPAAAAARVRGAAGGAPP